MKTNAVIDWPMLALDLRRHAPLKRTSLKLGLHIGYLGQLSRGTNSQPKYSDGVMLLNYHLDVCGLEKHKKLFKNADEKLL